MPDPQQLTQPRPLAHVVAVFGSVGAATTVLYFLLAVAASALMPAAGEAVSVMAYALAAVASYCGHKRLSFASDAAHVLEAPRFAAPTAVGLALAWTAPKLGVMLGLPAIAAYALVCVLAPAINFALLRHWVFASRLPGRQQSSRARPSIRRATAFGAAAIILAAFALQTAMWGTNTDTSWLITVIEKMRGGERLYRDIVELNPPFSIWLYLLPVRLAEFVPLPAEALVRAYVLLICLGGLGLAGWMLRDSRLMPWRAALPALAILLLVTTVLSGDAFSQRDHIGAVLVLPLFVLAAWRSESGGARPRPVHWLSAGAAGGVIALVKPYYALIVVAAAAWVALRRRDWRAFFLPEFLIAAAISLLYLVASYLAYPAFFSEFLPLLGETYMAFAWPVSLLAVQVLPWVGLPVGYYLLRRRGGGMALGDLLLFAAVIAWIPYFVQGKGWAYHAYPATLLASAAVVLAACSHVVRQRKRSVPGARPLTTMLVAGVTVFAAHAKFLPSGVPSRGLADQVRAHVSSPSVGVLGGDIASGHPFTRMIGGRWIEPYCSDWLAIYALRLEHEATAAGDVGRASHYAEMLDRYLAEKLRRLSKAPPDVLIIDREGGLVRLMLSEHGFSDLLSRYEKMAHEDGLEIYRRLPPTSS